MQKNKRRDESVTSLSIGDIALQMDSQFMGFYHNEENKSTILMIDSFFQPFFARESVEFGLLVGQKQAF